MLWLLSLVLAVVCFKLGALMVIVSIITYAFQAAIIVALALVIFGLCRWWRRAQWK